MSTFADAVHDQGLPAAVSAERTVLGAILLDADAFYEARVKLRREDFSLDSHRRIYSALCEQIEATQSTDVVRLGLLLENRDELNAVGGTGYLWSLTEGLPRRMNPLAYVDILCEKAKLRAAILAGNDLMVRAQSQDESADELLARGSQELLAIAGRVEPPSLKEQSEREMETMMRQRKGEEALFLTSGLESLDGQIGGYAIGELTVLAGRPMQGKSVAMAQAARAICKKGIASHIFSLEMTAGQLLRRIWAREAGIPFAKLRHPENLTDVDISYIARAKADVALWPLKIEETSRVTADDICARARASKRRDKTQFIAIDYLQKIRFPGKAEQRFTAIADAAIKLSNLARDERLSVLLLSSLTEKKAGGRNTPPTMDDLRMSGDIKYEASTVLLLHREVDDATERLMPRGKIIIGKARSDEGGSFDVEFDGSTLSFH